MRSMVLGLIVAMNGSVQAAMLHVDQHHPQASDTNDGSSDKPFKTINAAAQIAVSGDTVLVQPGVYREHIAPGKNGSGVTYISAKRHQAIVKGSDVWTPDWKPVADQTNVYIAPLDDALFAGRRNPYLRTISVSSKDKSSASRPIEEGVTDWPLSLGQLFVDGQLLTQATTLQVVYDTPATWILGEQGKNIVMHLPVHLHKVDAGLIELTVRDRVFAPSRRALKSITIDGFVFEHCANQGPFPQAGMISTRTGRDWVIRDNIVRYAKTVGIDIGSESWAGTTIPDTDEDQQRIMIGGNNHVINNVIEYNGLCGVAGWNTGGSVIRGNIVRHNNRLGFESKINAGWEEAGGIKVHAFGNGVIEGNLVLDNEAAGIWIDNGYAGARISRNFVSGSLGKGIFVELGKGRMLIDHNVVAYTRNYSDFYAGDGIYSHDAADLVITNNLLYHNARFGILGQVVSGRQFAKAPVETSGHQIMGNIFVGNNRAAISMPFAGKQSHDNHSDYNVFIGKDERLSINTNQGRIDSQQIEDALKTAQVTSSFNQLPLEDWQKVMLMDQNSVQAPTCRMIISAGEVTFTAMEAASTWTLPMPQIEGVTKDYFGRTIGEQAYAGPFGPITPGKNRWILWPIR
jgi:hypothetical protein